MDEAISRCLTQACVYGIEKSKTCIQIHGKTHSIPFKSLMNGTVTSSVSAGIVYFTYYSVYNIFKNNMLAGTLASSISCIIKVPISNSMRVFQASKVNTNIFQCLTKIKNTSGIKGLYSGIGLSLFEDIIEIDLRTRLYEVLSKIDNNKNKNITKSMIKGSAVGAAASSLCMPIDSLRAHMAYNSTQTSNNIYRNPLYIIKDKGIVSLYNGMHVRATISALKFALFYAFMEILRKKD